MKIREAYTCPLELTHDLTKGKWKPIILWLLGKGPSSLAGLEKNSTMWAAPTAFVSPPGSLLLSVGQQRQILILGK